MKCSRDRPACARCVREGIHCQYSKQKTMGRPKKRLRTEGHDDAEAHQEGETRERGGRTGGLPGTQGEAGAPQSWVADVGTEGPRDDTGVFQLDNDEVLQPWSQSRNWSVPGTDILPGLTPDTSSDSPPSLSLPPEQALAHSQFLSDTPDLPSLNGGHAIDNTGIISDPFYANANVGAPAISLPNCACLSSAYLTLNSLQQMDPTFAFPFALHPLREAMQTASTVLACDQCPQSFISAVQNTHLLGTLLMSIGERFGKVIASITAEATRADGAGDTKKFRLADLNTSASHLHTGGLGCAATFSIDLTPVEWRSMAKKVVRAEVYGPSDGNTCCPFFTGLTKAMFERQSEWHQEGRALPADFPRDKEGQLIGGPRAPREDHMCMKFRDYAERLVDGLDWS